MIKTVAIIGGGFAAWYTACSLRNNHPDISLTVIDSDRHPRLGVGETLGWSAPYDWRRNLGIQDDRLLMWNTGAIYKYGINVEDFWQDHKKFSYGKFFNLKVSSLTKFYGEFDYPEFYEPWSKQPHDVGMQQAWLSINKHSAKNFDDYIEELDESGHFASQPVAPYGANGYVLRPSDGYSYHIDAEQTVAYIRSLACSSPNAVRHVCSAVTSADVDGQGRLLSVRLENDTNITADIFIDATGFSRVSQQFLSNTSWQDMGTEYCNSAWVCPTRYLDPAAEITGGTDIFGEDWGWRFRVKLYHRAGQGFVFNSNMIDADIPRQKLLSVTDGRRLAEPRLITWTPGFYNEPWQSNVILLGISANFIDPYDAPTFDIHGRALEDLNAVIDQPLDQARREYNQKQALTAQERYLRLICSFGLSKRRGEFWNSRRSLAHKKDNMQQLRAIIEETSPIETRLRHFWHQMYYRMIIACDVDRTQFSTMFLTDHDRAMTEAFFQYNRARNTYIRQTEWPNYYEWLRANRFNGESHESVLERLNPQFTS